uniref:Type 4 fimbrial assembly protein pilB n=1 Tax=mine drainage metagenome TaxID=410659 RepID=E6QRF7_9ZZZZ
MSSHPPTPVTGLARALVNHQWLTRDEAELLVQQAIDEEERLIARIIKSKKIDSAKLAQFAASEFGYPCLDLNAIDPSIFPKGVLDTKLMRARHVLPIRKNNNRLLVAVSDPSNLKTIDELKFQTNLAVDIVVVEDDKLNKLIQLVTGGLINTTGQDTTPDDDTDSGDDEGLEADDAPIIPYLQKILMNAIKDKVSDIHFEPYEKFYRIRYRQDGQLHIIDQPPLSIREKLTSRIKVLSNLDISEKRVPQDGRMKLNIDKNRAIDFRVSTLPTLYGEKVVMRILDSTSAQLGIDALGYEDHQKQLLMDAIHRPHGMILVTGPTGSGKTVSLYTCLNILNQPGTNISTVEDPAEINLPGINQVTVNDKAGLNFASALKSFLRQDPDVIMVGEIRDMETAEISIKAAQTGHLVFSTLHTNDAPATVTRLINMGIAPFNIASSVILIIAQRLTRRLCNCKRPQDVPKEVLLQAGFKEEELDGSWQPFEAVGCDICKNSGYKGRVGIYQVMPITEALTRIIMNNGTSIDISDQARREGVDDLRRSGLNKVKRGLTSLSEIESLTNE